jgi:hypothetical protein
MGIWSQRRPVIHIAVYTIQMMLVGWLGRGENMGNAILSAVVDQDTRQWKAFVKGTLATGALTPIQPKNRWKKTGWIVWTVAVGPTAAAAL